MKLRVKVLLMVIASILLLTPIASAVDSSHAAAKKEAVKHIDPYRFLVYDQDGNSLKGSMLQSDGVWYAPLSFIAERLGGKVEYLDNGSQVRILMPGKQEIQTAAARAFAVASDQSILAITAQKSASGHPVTPIGGQRGEFYVPYDFFSIALDIPIHVTEEGTHKVVTIGDVPKAANRIDTSKLVSLEGKAVVRVNGVELPRQGSVYEVDGILYVPIATPVWEMGGKMEQGYTVEDIRNWDSSLSRFRLANEQVVESRLNDSVIKVSGKPTAIYTAQKKTEDGQPISAPVLQINNHMYVPYDFYQSISKYPVEVRKEAQKQVIYVGQIPASKPVYDLPYQPPYGWMPPKIKSKATNDMNKNLKILQEELYFHQMFFIPYGNPSGQSAESYAIRVNTGTKPAVLASIYFRYWSGGEEDPESDKIPYVARELFKFFLPDKGENLFKILDDGYNGQDVSQYVDKVFTLDGRSILIREYKRTLTTAGGVEVFIGKPGMKFDKNLNTINTTKK